MVDMQFGHLNLFNHMYDFGLTPIIAKTRGENGVR